MKIKPRNRVQPDRTKTQDDKPQPTPTLGFVRACWIFALLLVLLLGMLQVQKVAHLYRSSQHDVRATIACAHNLLAGRDIYRTHHTALPEDPTLTSDIPKFTYPPLLCFTFLPSTSMPYSEFKHIWFFLNIFFVLHGVYLLTSTLPWGRLKLPAFLVLAGLTVAAEPFHWILRTANFDAMTLYLMAWSMWAYQRNRYAASGVLISIASWLKVTPALIFFYLLSRGNRRFSVWAVVSGVVLGIVQVSVVGLNAFDFFLFEVLPERSAATARAPAMQCLWALNQILFVPSAKANIFDMASSFDAIHAASRLVVATLVILVIMRTASGPAQRFYGFAAMCTATILLTDSTWLYRYIWMAAPVAAALYAVVCEEKAALFIALPALTGIFLGLQFLFQPLFGELDGWRAVFLAAPSLGAVFCMFVTSGLAIAQGEWQPPLVWLARRALQLLKIRRPV